MVSCSRAATVRPSPSPPSAIRAVIDEHRHRDINDSPIAGATDEIATLRSIVEELAERVRRHEEQLHRPG